MSRKTLRLFACAAIMAMTLSFTACGGKTKTLEDVCNDPAVSSVLDSAFSAMAEEGITLDYKATGNELAYEIKFEDSSVTKEAVGETLEALLDQQADIYKQIAKSLDQELGKDGACTVTVRYLDANGDAMAEKSYKAD